MGQILPPFHCTKVEFAFILSSLSFMKSLWMIHNDIFLLQKKLFLNSLLLLRCTRRKNNSLWIRFYQFTVTIWSKTCNFCAKWPSLRAITSKNRKLPQKSSIFPIKQPSKFLKKCLFFNPKKGGRFWQLRRRGGSYVPTDKQSTPEATIFILHQQSVFYMKGVMFSVHLRPWWGRWGH